MINLRYRAKDGRVYQLREAANNAKLKGMYRINYLDYQHGYCITWMKRSVENPWLPADEAIANIKKVAALMGWQEEKAI